MNFVWLKLVKPSIGKLFWMFRVFFVTLWHGIENVPLYLKSKLLFFSDIKRILNRLFINPYRHTHLYGITPLKTLDRILKTFYLEPQSHFVDLGSGDGRLCQFASIFYHAQSTGLDINKSLIEKAQHLLPKMSFLHQDFLTFDFTGPDFVYFFATGFQDLEQLQTKFLDLKKGAKVVMVSEKLTSNQFCLWKQLTLPFVFGRANVYCYIRR